MEQVNTIERRGAISIANSDIRGNAFILDHDIDETIPLSPNDGGDELPDENTTMSLKFALSTTVPYLQSSMVGSLLLLRLPWIVGEAGVVVASILCIISGVSVALTSLSLGGIGTEARMMRSSFIFDLLQKNLGRELASSICLLFFMGKILSTAMYCLSSAESLPFQQNEASPIVICAILCAVAGLCNHNWLFWGSCIVLVMSIYMYLSVFVGVTVNTHISHHSNTKSNFSNGVNFYSSLGIYYPSVLGALAVSMQPGQGQSTLRKKFPSAWGTAGGVLLTTVLALILIFLFGSHVASADLLSNYLIAGKSN